mmetsp:Transcript_11353/g.24413  ORF Transcript_11353/g.24413 Transcript_11353/m.24413 type:complete len:200 (+) Transcript_11353:398-997(+)
MRKLGRRWLSWRRKPGLSRGRWRGRSRSGRSRSRSASSVSVPSSWSVSGPWRRSARRPRPRRPGRRCWRAPARPWASRWRWRGAPAHLPPSRAQGARASMAVPSGAPTVSLAPPLQQQRQLPVLPLARRAQQEARVRQQPMQMATMGRQVMGTLPYLLARRLSKYRAPIMLVPARESALPLLQQARAGQCLTASRTLPR